MDKKQVGRKTASSLEAQNHALFKFLVKMNTVVLVGNTAKFTQRGPLYRSGADALEMPRTTEAFYTRKHHGLHRKSCNPNHATYTPATSVYLSTPASV